MDVWGPARVTRQGGERYFLLVVDDCTRYSTVFPLQSKAEVRSVLIRWIRAVRFELSAWLRQDLLVLRLHSDRGGEFSSRLLEDFCVRYTAHQLNLWPRVSVPETSSTLRWTGEVGDVSEFRVWGSLSLVHDLPAGKLSPCTLRCVFLDFPSDAPPWLFYHPGSRRVLSSRDVTFDESVCFYRLHPHRSSPVPLSPLSLEDDPTPVAPLPPPETSSTLRWTGEVGDVSEFRVWGSLSLVHDLPAGKLSPCTLRCVFLDFPSDAPPWLFYHPGSRRVLSSRDVTFDESVCFYRLHPHRSSPVSLLPLSLILDPPPPSLSSPPPSSRFCSLRCVPTEGGDSAADDTTAPRHSLCLETLLGFLPRPSSLPMQPVAVDPSVVGGGDSEGAGSGGGESPTGGRVAGTPPRASGSGRQRQPSRQETLSPQELRAWTVRWGSPGGGAGGARAGGKTGGTRVGGTGGTGIGGADTKGTIGGTRVGGTGARGTSTGGAGAGGTSGGAGVGGTSRQESLSPQQLHAWAVRWDSPGGGAGGAGTGGAVTTGAGGSGGATTQQQPSALRHLLILPPAVTEFPVAGTTPLLLFPPPDQSQLHLLPHSPLPAPAPYTVVTESLTESREPEWRHVTPVLTRPHPPPVPGTHIMALRPSSVLQRVVLPPPPASSLPHVPDPEVKRPPGSPPAFKARYVVRGFSQREGVDFFQTFSPTPIMTTLRVLLHVAAQRDYELHSFDFPTTFLQGNLHEAIWLRHPRGRGLGATGAGR
ncbi:unnamed protein product [Closterium sp. NIES-53]